MIQRIIVAGALCVLPLAALALPVTFTSQQFNTSALAQAEGAVNGSSDSNPPTALSIFSDATAAGPSDFANAAAIANTGLLSAITYTDSFMGPARADAHSRFVGSFSGGGDFRLALDFDTSETLTGGSAGSAIFVLLTSTVGSTTTTLFNNVFTASGSHLLDYTLTPNSTTKIDLFLTDHAATMGAGQAAQSIAQVTYAVTLVPEPATWLMLGLGTGALLLRRRQHATHVS